MKKKLIPFDLLRLLPIFLILPFLQHRLTAQENACPCAGCEVFSASINPNNPCEIIATPVQCPTPPLVESWIINGVQQGTNGLGGAITLNAVDCGPNTIQHFVACDNGNCQFTASITVEVVAQEISISDPIISTTIDCNQAKFEMA